MFGWDWGPRLPDAGIWRDIALIGIERARIRDVLVLQEHAPDAVTLRVQTHIQAFSDGESTVQVTVTDPDGRIYAAEGPDVCIRIPEPRLWWPAGFGNQPLYRVSVSLKTGDRLLDSWSRKIGLRTMTVSRRKDEWGESFSHCVNGVDSTASTFLPWAPTISPRTTCCRG